MDEQPVQLEDSRADRRVTQLRRDLPSSWIHDDDRFPPLGGHHAESEDGVRRFGVVRDDGCRLEQPIPGVVQEMGRKIHVRTLLFHDVEFRDYCIRQQGGCLASSLPVPEKAKGDSGERPLSRQHAASGYLPAIQPRPGEDASSSIRGQKFPLTRRQPVAPSPVRPATDETADRAHAPLPSRCRTLPVQFHDCHEPLSGPHGYTGVVPMERVSPERRFAPVQYDVVRPNRQFRALTIPDGMGHRQHCAQPPASIRRSGRRR